MIVSSELPTQVQTDQDAQYHQLLCMLKVAEGPLFTTNTPTSLFPAFLAVLPDGMRQQYTCNACSRFIETYGGLVTIAEDGSTKSAIWPQSGVPPLFEDALEFMRDLAEDSRVISTFYDDRKVWGTPVTGPWSHMAVTPAASQVYTSRTKTAGQAMAESREEYAMLQRAIVKYSAATVETALTILEADALYRTEKVLGVAKWFAELKIRVSSTKNHIHKDNIVRLAVATAPTGFCHISSSMIGTLLDDIADGLSFAEISARFAEKMNPLQYQRPQAAPAAGNIKRAEEIVAKLGLAASLRRRFARLDEIVKVWEPKRIVVIGRQTPVVGGVFAHLYQPAQPTKTVNMPLQKITYTKFERDVLPRAEKLEFYVPTGNLPYTALVTAVDPTAPPILQWDTPEQRNPVSWYMYSGGSTPQSWNLRAGDWHNVAAICHSPAHWYGGNPPNHRVSAVLILEGAKDLRYERSGLAIFPEFLLSELREVRFTIEAHSKSGVLQGADEASACGISIPGQGPMMRRVRVTTGTIVTEYNIDRWD